MPVDPVILNRKKIAKRHSFIVMEKLEISLWQHVLNSNIPFTLWNICHIGCRVIEILEKVHSIGLVYNDLKLDNIILASHISDS